MYNILVCDDEKDIVSALTIYLTTSGYQVFPAYDGTEALALLEKEDIHLVLLDIMMPQLDGIATMTRGQKTAKTHHGPAAKPDDLRGQLCGPDGGAAAGN